MKKLNVFLTIMVVSLLCACAGSDSPSDVARKIGKIVKSGELEKLEPYLYKDMNESPEKQKRDFQFLIAMVEEKGAKQMEKDGALVDFEVLEEQIAEDGQSAMVKVKYTYEKGKEKMEDQKYVLQEGEWKYKISK